MVKVLGGVKESQRRQRAEAVFVHQVLCVGGGGTSTLTWQPAARWGGAVLETPSKGNFSVPGGECGLCSGAVSEEDTGYAEKEEGQ